jgi:hypothetical protein
MSNDNGFTSFANIHYALDRSDNLIMLFCYKKNDSVNFFCQIYYFWQMFNEMHVPVFLCQTYGSTR